MSPVIGGIGDLTVDILLPGLSRFPEWGQEVEIEEPRSRLGGNIGNMATGASALNNDFLIYSMIGQDEEGAFILDSLGKLGLKTSCVRQTGKKRTSRTYAGIREDGERFMLTYKGTLELMEELMAEAAGPADVLFLSGWCLPPRVHQKTVLDKISNWHMENRVIAADLLWSDETWEHRQELLDVLKKTDIVFLNETELLTLTEEADFEHAVEKLKLLIGLTPRTQNRFCAIKLGKKGAMLLDGSRCLRVSAYPSKPVDTVGAGDLFNIGFLHALYKLGLKPPEALCFASTFASVYISRYYALPPTEAEIMQLIGTKG